VVVRLDIVLGRIPVYSVISDLKDLPVAFVGRSPSLLFDMSMDNGIAYKHTESETFWATIGILIGDVSSPILWNTYMSDLIILVHLSDILLAGIYITNLEHADDIILIATSPKAL